MELILHRIHIFCGGFQGERNTMPFCDLIPWRRISVCFAGFDNFGNSRAESFNKSGIAETI